MIEETEVRCGNLIVVEVVYENTIGNRFKGAGKAVCSSNDTFDYATGYKLARQRALVKAYKAESKYLHNLLVEDTKSLNARIRQNKKLSKNATEKLEYLLDCAYPKEEAQENDNDIEENEVHED